MKIEKKIWPEYFEKILSGEKTFEVRLADFKCKIGDLLILKEWNPKTKKYTGRKIEKKINYLLKTKNLQFWPNEDARRYGFYVIGWKERTAKQLQDEVKLFCKKNKIESPIEFRLLDLTSEVGEVAKEILKMNNYGRNKLQKNDEIEMELGDVFYSLITIANYFDVDLEKALIKAIEKYAKRKLFKK